VYTNSIHTLGALQHYIHLEFHWNMTYWHMVAWTLDISINTYQVYGNSNILISRWYGKYNC